jgi:hypothetical protein
MTADQVNPSIHPFLFAAGIENSYPVVVGKDGKRRRVDERAKRRHYERWREDFSLVRGSKAPVRRYPQMRKRRS